VGGCGSLKIKVWSVFKDKQEHWGGWPNRVGGYAWMPGGEGPAGKESWATWCLSLGTAQTISSWLQRLQ